MTEPDRDNAEPALRLTPGQVKEARRQLGWAQADLAAAARISVSSVNRFEFGQRLFPANALALAEALAAAGIVVGVAAQVVLREPPPSRPDRRRFTAEQVRQARRLLGWHQADLASRAGISRSTVGRLERRRRIGGHVTTMIARTLMEAGVVVDSEDIVGLSAPHRRATDLAGAPAPLALEPRQAKEARDLLGWSRPELAAAAGLAFATISKFELGYTVRSGTRGAIMTALSAASIVVDADGRIAVRPKP